MSMYNHRGLPGAPNPNNSRLNELLDQIRVEFENQARASEGYDHTSKRPDWTLIADYLR